MKKCLILLFAMTMAFTGKLSACDVCGGGTSSMAVGLLSDYSNNYVRMSYFHAMYLSTRTIGKTTEDHFHQYELSARMSVSDAIRVRVSIPYQNNVRTKGDEVIHTNGLGDIRAIAFTPVLDRVFRGNSSLYIEGGLGVSIPTGRFDEDIQKRNVPESFNPGKGAWAGIIQLHATYINPILSVSWSNNYTYNPFSSGDYHYGDDYSSYLTFFREIQLDALSLIPNAGIGYEHTYIDKYASGFEVRGTGGNGTFASLSLNVKRSNIIGGVSYMIPLHEEFSKGEVSAQPRMNFQLSYIF